MKTTTADLKKYSRLRAHLKAARAYAAMSYAKRLRVGAVLLIDDRPVAVGYNGMPAGFPNDCEIESTVDPTAPLATRPEVTHAEMNCIGFAAAAGVKTDGCIMVLTHSPCYECSKLIIAAKIREVYYATEYRLTDSLDFLRRAGIKVERIDNEQNGKTQEEPSGQGDVQASSSVSGDVHKNKEPSEEGKEADSGLRRELDREVVAGFAVHDEKDCEPPCPFHAPSDHPLKFAPIHIREDKNFLVERICPHGVGHDDPDSVQYMHKHGQTWAGVHGCDGCCVENAQ